MVAAVELLELAAGELLPSLAIDTLLTVFMRPGEGGRPALGVVSYHPGRVRVKVEGLRGDGTQTASVEQALRLMPGITSASASALTGSVLVHYDPDRVTVPEIRRFLNQGRRRTAGRPRLRLVPPLAAQLPLTGL